MATTHVYRCKAHGYRHFYTVCRVCECQYCPGYWPQCPRCAERIRTIHADVRTEAARYGNLAFVAMNFHIQTGNLAELDAAVIYARTAAHFAQEEVR